MLRAALMSRAAFVMRAVTGIAGFRGGRGVMVAMFGVTLMSRRVGVLGAMFGTGFVFFTGMIGAMFRAVVMRRYMAFAMFDAGFIFLALAFGAMSDAVVFVGRGLVFIAMFGFNRGWLRRGGGSGLAGNRRRRGNDRFRVGFGGRFTGFATGQECRRGQISDQNDMPYFHNIPLVWLVVGIL